MISYIEDDLAEAIMAETGSETPAEVSAVLADLWTALENPEQVVERERQDREAPRA